MKDRISECYEYAIEVSTEDIEMAVEDGDVSEEDARLILADLGGFVSYMGAVLEEEYFREAMVVAAMDWCDNERLDKE